MPKKFNIVDSPYKDVMKRDVKAGDRFWHLTVIAPHEEHNKLVCKCDCGTVRRFDFYNIRKGASKSCGCLSVSNCKQNFTKHSLRNHPLYRVWAGVKNRCLNENEPRYCDYGGSGVSICDEWAQSFEAFYDWAICNGYDTGLTLDRIDSRGNYEPSNCRWADRSTQAQNRRANKDKLLPKGVSKHGHKYRARIMQDYTSHMLGDFDTPELAHEAYRKEAIKRFGVCYEAVR